MKKTGKCPKCGSLEIYTDRNQTKNGERMFFPISSWKKIYLDTYFCENCGYIEEYAEENDLKDKSKIAKLKSNWKKT